MSKSQRFFTLGKAYVVMMFAGALVALSLNRPGEVWHASARMLKSRHGEFGGDLDWLRRYHVGPQAAGESNHYFDLWCGNSLSVMAQFNNLTNNRSLFVDSHGKAGPNGYWFYPNSALLKADERTPFYSVRDLARVMGRQQALSIHNVLLAGCNTEGRLRSSDVRRHFPNATNITYMTPGELAFKPMYYQAIILPAAEIRSLYSSAHRTNEGRIECRITTSAVPEAQPLAAYISDLYLPSARKPYRTVRASRERLESQPPPAHAEPSSADTSSPSTGSGQAPSTGSGQVP